MTSVGQLAHVARESGDNERRALGGDVAAAIDEALRGPVLVVGSAPPGGRDLDLLARPDDYATVSRWLERAGFVPWKPTWARFDGPGLYAVELSSTERWQTRRDDASSLFIDTVPIPRFRHLVSPGPATVLLLAAHGTVTRRGTITEKVRRRVAQALECDPGAWAVAERRGRSLGMVGPLRLLRGAYQAGAPLPVGARAVGMCRMLIDEGPLGTKARFLVGAGPKRLRPTIVSFSGLDGSGKSTQTLQLQARLRELGVSAELQWAGFRAARLVRAAVPLLDRPIGAGRHSTRPRDRLIPAALVDSPVGRHAWALLVVSVNAAHLWRLVLRRRTSRILIFDRFTPDTTVKLDLLFHRTRHIDVRWQRRLFTLISPKPAVGFLVNVSSQVAHSRRQEQTPDELASMYELYQEQVARYRLHRLDGTQTADALAKHVAVTAWSALQ